MNADSYVPLQIQNTVNQRDMFSEKQLLYGTLNDLLIST